MKKKWIFLFGLFLITGCRGKIEEDAFIKEKLSTTIEHFECEVKVQDIKEFSSYQNLFLTKDGKLYKWEKEKLENGKHCEAINNNLTFERFIYGVIVGKDEKLYAYINNQLVDTIPESYEGAIDQNLYQKNKNVFEFSQNFEESDYQYATSVFYLAKLEGNRVFLYDTNNEDIITKEIGSIDKNEKILWYGDNVIKTDKAYYNYGKTNKKECLKKKNVECLYGVSKVEDPTYYYDIIETYSGGYFVLKKKDGIYSLKTSYND